jgi:hypothetical protein
LKILGVVVEWVSVLVVHVTSVALPHFALPLHHCSCYSTGILLFAVALLRGVAVPDDSVVVVILFAVVALTIGGVRVTHETELGKNAP